MTRLSRITAITAGALMAGSVAAFAADSVSGDTPTQSSTTVKASTTTAPATTAGSTRAEEKIASEFAIFAGSQDNARSLVTGLRLGGEVTLVTPTGSGQAGTGTKFSVPTRPMGNGNVRISLALAQEQLIRAGITQPTADQLRAALVGGTVTTGSGPTATTTELKGVLQMRADGMGWGQIANAMGTKLGHVMSGLKQTNRQLAAGQTVPGAGAAGSAGVSTAAGTSGATSPRGNGRGTQARAGGEAGAGIVTAAGGPAATGSVQGGGEVRGAGLVTGAGVSAGSRASASGLANGKGHAKP